MATSSDGHAVETAISNEKSNDSEAKNDDETIPVLPLTEMDEKWHPQLEDFNDPEFNRYISGPTKLKPHSTAQAPWPKKAGKGMADYVEPYRVFINRVPFNLQEDGIITLCEKYSSRPLSVYKRPEQYISKDIKGTWAIVEYATHGEAEKLIRTMHRVPPFYMDLKFGMTDEEKEKHARSKEEKRFLEEAFKADEAIRKPVREMLNEINSHRPFMDGQGRPMGIGRGLPVAARAQQISWPRDADPGALTFHGKPNVNLNSNYNPFNIDREVNYFGNYAGGYNDESSSVITKSAEEMKSIKPFVSNTGTTRQTFGGRGYNMPNRRDESRVGAMSNRHNRSYTHRGLAHNFSNCPEHSMDPRGGKNEDNMKKREHERGLNPFLSNGNLIAPPGGMVGNCRNCKGITSSMCVSCGTWICCEVCRSVLGEHPLKCIKMQPNQVDMMSPQQSMAMAYQVQRQHQQQFGYPQQQQQQLQQGFRGNRPQMEHEMEYYGGHQQGGLRHEAQNKTDITESILKHIGKTCQRAESIIQNIMTVFSEPVGFVCSLTDLDVADMKSKLNCLQDVCNNENKDKTISFTQGEMVAVKLDGSQNWCRGIIDSQIDETKNTWHVLGCDSGLSMELTSNQIQHLPDELKKIPRFTVAGNIIETYIPINKVWEEFIMPGSELVFTKVFRIQHDSSEHVIGSLMNDKDELICVVEFIDWLPLRPRYIPQYSVIPLPTKCDVILSTVCSSNKFYVRIVKDKAIKEEFEQLHQNIANHCYFNTTAVNELPEVGQIVGVRSGIDNNYYRGLVTRHTSKDSVLIFFVDHGNKELIELGNIFSLPQDLAQAQSHAILIQLKDMEDLPFKLITVNYFNKLVLRQIPLELECDDSNDSVTLRDTVLCRSVSQVIKDTLLGSWERKTEVREKRADDLLHNYSKGFQTMDTLLMTQLPLKQPMKLLCLSWCKDTGSELYCCLASHPLLRYIACTMTKLMTQYVDQVCPTGLYVPLQLEVCLAQSSQDGYWYRGWSTGNTLNLSQITFLDFGHFETLPFEKIRKMPSDFVDAPVLATLGVLVGLEENDFQNKEISQRVSEFMRPNTTFEAIALSKSDDISFNIYVPRLINRLISEGLIPESRKEKILKELDKIENMNQDILPQYLDKLDTLKSNSKKILQSNLNYPSSVPNTDSMISFDNYTIDNIIAENVEVIKNEITKNDNLMDSENLPIIDSEIKNENTKNDNSVGSESSSIIDSEISTPLNILNLMDSAVPEVQNIMLPNDQIQKPLCDIVMKTTPLNILEKYQNLISSESDENVVTIDKIQTQNESKENGDQINTPLQESGIKNQEIQEFLAELENKLPSEKCDDDMEISTTQSDDEEKVDKIRQQILALYEQ